jgi:hypothetical protein
MRKVLKLLHTLGAAGYMGALAACAVVLARVPQATAREVADMRGVVDAICMLMLFPSMGLVLLSGLLAMAAHRPFLELRWVWAKAVLGIAVFEGTLIVVQGRARRAAELASEISAGTAEPSELARVVATEWASLGVMLAIAVASTMLAIWRPRLGARRPPEAGA